MLALAMRERSGSHKQGRGRRQKGGKRPKKRKRYQRMSRETLGMFYARQLLGKAGVSVACDCPPPAKESQRCRRGCGCPAYTTVAVAFADPLMKVEIDCIAYRPR